MKLSKMKDKPKYKNELERYVIHAKLGGIRKLMTPCTCVMGLQVLLQILDSDNEVAVQYRKLSMISMTRLGAGDDMRDISDANKSGPNANLLRQAWDHHKRNTGGASINASSEQVLPTRLCALVRLALTLEPLSRSLLWKALRLWR
jgi:hypothetical protein